MTKAIITMVRITGNTANVGKRHKIHYQTHFPGFYHSEKYPAIPFHHRKIRKIPCLFHTLFSNLGFPAKMIQQKKFRKHGNCGNQIQPAHNRNHVMFAYQNNGQW